MYCHVKSKEVAEKIKEAIPEAKIDEYDFITIEDEKYAYLIEGYNWSKGLRIYDRKTKEDILFISLDDIYVVYEL